MKLFVQFLFGGLGLKQKECEYEQESDYFINSDNTNILRKSIINLFQNLKTLTIYDAQSNGEYWSFSLLELLNLINDTKIEQVTLHGKIRGFGGSTWFSYLWTSSSDSLKATFNNDGWDINFEAKWQFRDYHWINITKQKNIM